MAEDKAVDKVAAEAEKERDKAAAERDKAAAEEQKMLAGEVPLANPDSADWPDEIPMQSRYGDPADFVTPQSLQSAEEEEQKAANQAKPQSAPAPTKTGPNEQPAKSEAPAGK